MNEPFPIADSNSPLFWLGEQLYMFASSAGQAHLTTAPNVYEMKGGEAVRWTDANGRDYPIDGGRWMEAVVPDDRGYLYGYYHNEPHSPCGDGKTAPRIGAGRSADGGKTWVDLGFIITAPNGLVHCDSTNHYFNGGTGDHSAVLDRNGDFLYIYFSNYTGSVIDQGISVARLDWRNHRDTPSGNVRKYLVRDRSYSDPWEDRDGAGLGGFATTIFRANRSWHGPGRDSDAPWGPSVHFNSHLNRYVMLMNRAIDNTEDWRQAGVYVSYSADPMRMESWTDPYAITGPVQWYPQVVGLPRDRGTDREAGRWATFKTGQYLLGTLVFGQPDEEIACPPPDSRVSCRDDQ